MRLPLFIILIACHQFAFSQNPTPAPPQKERIMLLGGVLHTGTGAVIQNGYVIFENGKITAAGDMTTVKMSNANAKVIQLEGKHIYPGFIAPNTSLGLVEIEEARATRDNAEVGYFNPTVRSLIAYNADSKIVPTVKSNGVLLAETVPQGGFISGLSSVVQLDAWNWEDAAYATDMGLHIRLPNMSPRRMPEESKEKEDPNQQWKKQLDDLRSFFNEAKAYCAEPSHEKTNLKLESMQQVFNGNRRVFLHAHNIKEILWAIQFIHDYQLKGVIVDAEDAYLAKDELFKNQIPVILPAVHSLPNYSDDDIQEPYKQPGQLQKAGVLFCLSHRDFSGNQRNLPFEAGTAAAYGLTKEQALQSITLNAAKILGIDNRTGSIEIGKDANIIISTGDVLDMKTSNVVMAFIQGREVNLDNQQKQLNEKYKAKYGLK